MQRAYGYVYDPLNRLLQGDFVARTTGATPSAGAWQQELDRYRLSFVSYDDNGNINTLRRQGLLQAGTHNKTAVFGAVDNLTYAYQGNRLQSVDDQVSGNQRPQPAGYHGAPTSLAGDFQDGGVHQGQEYLYDAAGNLTADKNKGITGILYNHLNLPRQIHFGNGADSVVFRYTAGGQKVAKLVYQSGKPLARTDYLGPYQYEGDSLRFFPHAAGRVLRFVSYDDANQTRVSYQREYTVKDHLGNLRLAYRAGQVRTLTATLEQDENTHKRETQQFDSLSVSPPVAVNTSAAHSGAYAAKLNAGGSTPQPLGPLTQLGVQRGDTVTVTAFGYYPQAEQHGFLFSLASFLANLVHPAQAPPPGLEVQRRKDLPLVQVGVAAGLASIPQLSNGVPQGYVRVLVFNKDSALVDQQVQQLTQAANGGYERLRLQVVLPQDGYITTYVGNESDVDVLFDDVSVEHRPGLQVQENNYDPWGLSLAGLDYSSPGIQGLNKYQFNGKERQNDLGLGWSDYGARFHDPARGPGWMSPDPLADKTRRWSPYAFSFDNSIRFIDPDGMAVLDNYIFNEEGNYVRTDKNNKPDALVIKNSKTGKQQSYQFNDPVADVQAIKNGIATKGTGHETGITRVETLSDSKVENMINKSGVKTSEARSNPLSYAWKEGAGSMDYGAHAIGDHDLKKNTFYLREGVAYNVGDMGNYLFGRGAAELGISKEAAMLGGQVNNMLFGRSQKTPLYDFGPGTNGPPSFLDSPSDQRAIYNGHTNSPVGVEMIRQEQKFEKNAIYGL